MNHKTTQVDYISKEFLCCNFGNYLLCTHCQLNNIINLGTKEQGFFFSKKFDIIYESYLSTLKSTVLQAGDIIIPHFKGTNKQSTME